MDKRATDPTLDLVIEPMRGATYNEPGKVAVYGYGTYPKSSVNRGQTRRCFLDSFDSVEEAKKAYPKASVSESTGYIPQVVSSDDDDELGDMEQYERECLDRERYDYD